VYNITSKWAPLFDKRAQNILTLNTSSMICQLGSYKWLTLNKLHKTETFYQEEYLTNAKKCTSYLSKVRSSFLCMLCDTKVSNETVFYDVKPSQKVGGADIRYPITYLSQDTGDYFLSQCIDYIYLKNILVQRTNIEFVLSLCDKEGNFIAKEGKKDWKKVLPTLTNSDLEYIKICKMHLLNSKELINEADIKAASLACQRLAERYFTVNMMIRDDINEFHNFKYMHNILKDIFHGNLNEAIFFISNEVQDSHIMSFSNVVFKFKNKYDDQTEEAIQKLKNKKAIELLGEYYPISNMKAFPLETFVSSGYLNGCLFILAMVGLVYSFVGLS
jgi:hypothetical protein